MAICYSDTPIHFSIDMVSSTEIAVKLSVISPKYAAVIIAGNQTFYLTTALDISLRLQASGMAPVVIDLFDNCYTNTNQFNPKLCRVFGVTNPLNRFVQALEKNGIDYRPAGEVQAELDESMGLSMSHNEIESCAISMLRDEQPASASIRKIHPRLLFEFASSASSLIKIFNEHGNPTEIHIPNGRFPHQEAASQVSRFLDIPQFFYEKWFELDKYFHMDFRTHDRSEIQRGFLDGNTRYSETHFDNATKWFESRLSRFGDFDDYTWGWSQSQSNFDETKEPIAKKATIFTSSEDETMLLGEAWDAPEWQGQWQAIRLAVQNLANRGYQISIRIHPNLSNKSRRSYRRTIKTSKLLKKDFPDIEIVRHDATIDSYELGKRSDVIIVWNSTLGLEFEALGKPIYYFAPSIYSGVTSARPWHDHCLDEVLEFSISTDPNLAHAYMDYLLALGKPFSKLSTAYSRDFSDIGKRVVFVQWLSSERTVFASFKRLLSVLTHRSLRASFTILYRKMKVK